MRAANSLSTFGTSLRAGLRFSLSMNPELTAVRRCRKEQLCVGPLKWERYICRTGKIGRPGGEICVTQRWAASWTIRSRSGLPPELKQVIIHQWRVRNPGQVVSLCLTSRFIATHENDGTWAVHMVEQCHVDLKRQIGTLNTVVGQSRLVLDPVQVQVVGHRADGNENVASVDIHACPIRTGH